MPLRGPLLLSFLYPLEVRLQVWPAESVTVKLSVPLDDSRQNATRRSPGLVVTFTENEAKAVPLASMSFCTCTRVGAEPEEVKPLPVTLAFWGLPLSWSVSVTDALRSPRAAG